MNKNKKILVGVVVVILAVAVIVGIVVFGPKKPTPGELRVGILLPLTGDGASYGKKELNGILLAIDEANASRRDGVPKIVPITEDSQGKPAVATTAMHKLISKDKVPVVIGPAFSSPALAVVPIADKNGVLLMSPSASSPKLTGAGKLFFRVWPSDTAEAESVAKVATGRLKLNSFAVFHVDNEYGVGLKDVFEKTVKAANKEVLFSEGFREGQTDFRTALTKIKSLAPDGIYIPGYYKELSALLRQAKELGVKGQFLSCATFHEPELLKLAGDAASGVVFVQPEFDLKSDDPKIQQFAKQYKSRFDIDAGIYSAHGYDAAMALARTLNGGARTPEDIRKALLDLKDFSGLTGRIKFLPTGDCEKSVRVMTVRDGQFVDFK